MSIKGGTWDFEKAPILAKFMAAAISTLCISCASFFGSMFSVTTTILFWASLRLKVSFDSSHCCGNDQISNMEMLAFFFFRSSKISYSNLAKGVGEVFGFVVWSIVLGLEGVFLDEIGI